MTQTNAARKPEASTWPKRLITYSSERAGHDSIKPETLSPREFEIAKMLCSGMTNKEAAQVLGIGTRTVECHRFKIMLKTRSRSFAGLVTWAIKVGLV